MNRKTVKLKILTEKLRDELKKPYGELLRGKEEEIKVLLAQKLRAEKPIMVVAVGDIVSRTLKSLDVNTKLYIYDEKTKRAPFFRCSFPVDRFESVKNPAGVLTDEAVKTVKNTLETSGRVALKVEGEEDLLTLPAIIHAPEGAVVLYGQPDEGIVYVKITDETKKLAERILERMDIGVE